MRYILIGTIGASLHTHLPALPSICLSLACVLGRTKAGEWRLTTFTGKVYHSWDYIHWASPPNGSDVPLFPQGECPSFFKLPALVPGWDAHIPNADKYDIALPTHVHKRSNGGDYMQVGTYSDGAPNTTGSWIPLFGVGEQRIDASPGWGLCESQQHSTVVVALHPTSC